MEEILFWRSVREGLVVVLGGRLGMRRGRVVVMLLVDFGGALVARGILGLDSSVGRGLVNGGGPMARLDLPRSSRRGPMAGSFLGWSASSSSPSSSWDRFIGKLKLFWASLDESGSRGRRDIVVH